MPEFKTTAANIAPKNATEAITAKTLITGLIV